MPEPTKRMTYQELMAAEPDDLSVEDLQRRINLTALKKAEREVEMVENQNVDYQDKKAEKKRVADGKTIIIADENARIERERSICKHKTGGKGLPGFYNGDGKQGYAVATQQLPTGEKYFLCFRCQNEWHLPSKRAVLKGELSLKDYRKLEAEYYAVAAWDKPLFETDSGMTPGSVLFRIPRLEEQKVKDDMEFQAMLDETEGVPVGR